MLIEPARQIASFIRAQAEPIRDNLWFEVILAFKIDQVRPRANLEAIGIEVLSELEGSEAFHRCVHIIGWLDFSLARNYEIMEKFHTKFGEASDDTLSKTMGLAAPLRRRYFEQAAADWKTRRESVLSAATLHRSYNVQLAGKVRR